MGHIEDILKKIKQMKNKRKPHILTYTHTQATPKKTKAKQKSVTFCLS